MATTGDKGQKICIDCKEPFRPLRPAQVRCSACVLRRIERLEEDD